MSGVEALANAQVVEFGEVAAWGLIVAAGVYAAGLRRKLTTAGAVALAALAALATKAVLLPLM